MLGSLRCAWPVAAAAAVLFAAAPADAAPNKLVYKFQKGSKLKYRLSIGTDIDAEQQGEGGMGGMGGMAAGGMKIKNNYEFTMTWQVLEVKEDGSAKIKSIITRIKGSVESPMMGEMTFDTDDAGDAPADPDGGEGEGGGMGGMGGSMARMGKFFEAMKGGTSEFVVSTSGEIKKHTGMDKVMEKAIKAVEEQMSGAGGQGGQGGGPGGMGGMGGMGGGGAGMMTRMLGQFGDDMWKPWLETALVRLPTKSVELGDAWTGKSTTPLPIGNAKIVMEYTYALAGIENGEASFIVDGSAKLKKGESGKADKDDPMAKINEALEFKEITESGTDGMVTFDVTQGLVKESKITAKQVTKMTLDIGKLMEAFMGGGGGGGMGDMPKSELKVTNTTKTALKLLKVTPADAGEGF